MSSLNVEDKREPQVVSETKVLIALLPPYIPEYPPLELAWLAAHLRAKQISVGLQDLNIELFDQAPEERQNLWSHAEINNWAVEDCLADYARWLELDYDRLAEKLLADDPDFIYFHVHRPNLTLTRRVARRIKEQRPAIQLLYGGPSTAITGERLALAKEECDRIILGEPELSVEEFVRQTTTGCASDTIIQGVVDPADPERFHPRPPLRDLGRLSFPTYEDFNLSLYLREEMPLIASRGCPYRCAFCSDQPRDGLFRRRPAEQIIQEVRHHIAKYNTEAFIFLDLIANGDLEQLAAIAEGLAGLDKKITWEAQMTPRGDMTFELFQKLARSGLQKVVFGLESGSDNVLARMNKRYDSKAAADCFQAATAAGLDVHVNLIVGYPGEDEPDLLDTMRFLQHNQKFINWLDAVFPCYLLPNCDLEKNFENHGLWLPDQEHFHKWHYRNKNNFSYREKKVKELALFIDGLDIHFNLDLFVAPDDPIRQIADRVTDRLHKKIKNRPEVALVAMPPWGVNNPPVGLAYLSSYLRDHDVQTEMFDYNINFYNSLPQPYKLLWHVENKNYWSNEDTFKTIRHALDDHLQRAVQEILDSGCQVIGFSVVDPRERITVEMIRLIRAKNKHARIILGGPACHTPDYRRILEEKAGHLIDGYCIGEGEEVILEVVRHVREGRPIADIPGLLTISDGKSTFEPRPPVKDMSTLSFPRYEEFDFNAYPGDSLILEWSRGCIGSCTYCKGKEIGGRYRCRPADHIFAELKHHVEINGYDNFTICDPLFNGDLKVLENLCDKIIAAGYKIRWNGEAIPRKNMSGELIKKLAQAGCYEIQYGIECASDSVLGLMNKSRFFTVAEAARVIRATHEAGIRTSLFILTGFPGETVADHELTVKFIEDNAKWIDQIKSINSIHIITDTPLHKKAKEFELVLPEMDYHYLWSTVDGTNTPEERNRRTRAILKVCNKLGIEVLETNLAEGKQYDLAEKVTSGEVDQDEQVKILLAQVNKLDSFQVDQDEACRPSDEEEAVPVKAPSESETLPDALPLVEPASGAVAETAGEPSEFIKNNLDLVGFADGKKPYAGPQILEVDLTNNCNLNCVGCWCHSDLLGDKKFSGKKKRQMLDYELMIKLIDEAASMGVERFQLAGAGEPFIHPKIMEIIERIKSHGMKVTIITNFILVDDKKAERLVELGVDNITCSVWAGTPEMYQLTHPNQKGKRFSQMKNVLQHLHQAKQKQGVSYPQIKIYNVISHLNASGLTDMVNWATEALADYIEFTPIDIIRGVTDELALTAEDRELLIAQLDNLPKQPNYIELDPGQNPVKAEASAHGKEFARFIKRDLLDDWFRYELDDIRKFDVLCPRKEWKLDIQEDNRVENALLFYYPKEECERCPLADKCPIDTKRHVVKVEFTSFLGFGAFFRRISSETSASGTYDANIVNELPCYVGWTYARVLTTGEVIPCCKADKVFMGNLNRDSFRKIWTSPTYDEFRQKALTLPKTDDYFAAIRCLDACDNLGMNQASDDKRKTISEDQGKEVQGWVGDNMLLLKPPTD